MEKNKDKMEKNKKVEVKKIKVWYDDQINEVVDSISIRLNDFGLTIEELGGGDGFIEYEIKTLK
jgi:hypothetical protein